MTVWPGMLSLALLLRSLVAPGYEVANLAHDGGLDLQLVWCIGLNGIHAPVNGGHRGHPPPDGGADDHFTAACGLWTGNTSFISNIPGFTGGASPAAGVRYASEPRRAHLSAVIRKDNPGRAPPRAAIL